MLKIIKKAEALDKEVLPFECLGSPDCSIDRTFISTFHFPRNATKPSKTKSIYRNPIYLAREYKQMIDSSPVRNQSELARKFGISRVRVHQMLNLLKLNPLVVHELETLGDPLNSKFITERMLRPYVNKSQQEQKVLLNILRTFFKL